jgi:hypothetical protein
MKEIDMSNLESKGFVAADADVVVVTKGIIDATQNAEGGRGSYLRMLIGTTQHELGVAPRKRRQKAEKLSAEGIEEQLKALSAVHERFYAIVTTTVTDAVAGTKDKALEVNRRTNFARTALGSVRAWIRAGGDITSLAPATATKAMLAVETGTKPQPSAQALKSRAESQSQGLLTTFEGLATSDKAAAIEQMQMVLGQLTTQLLSLGVVSTKDPALSFEEHRPLRIGKQLFVPAAGKVIMTEGRMIS